jgi:hypothetical protein
VLFFVAMEPNPDESAAMPMCPCPDCRQPISSRARVCVFCGADAGAHETQALRITAIASVVAGAVSLAGLYALASTAGNSVATRTEMERSAARPDAFASATPADHRPARFESALAREPLIVIAPTPAGNAASERE